jgi:hypothetical protein
VTVNFKSEIKVFSKNQSLIVNEDALIEGEYTRYELEDSLFLALNENGLVQYCETGTSPAEYLPSVIEDCVALLAEEPWSITSLTTADNWQTAKVVLSCNDDNYSFTINHINNCDWLPADLSEKLYEFSKVKANQRLMTFFSDDPYLVLALSHEASKELESIIDRYTVHDA